VRILDLFLNIRRVFCFFFSCGFRYPDKFSFLFSASLKHCSLKFAITKQGLTRCAVRARRHGFFWDEWLHCFTGIRCLAALNAHTVRRETSPSVLPFCDYQETTQIGVLFSSTFLSYLPVLYGSQGKFERICAFCHFPEFGNATSFPFLSCDFHYPDEFSFTFSAHLRTSRQDSFFCATFLLHVFILDYINGPGEMSPEIVLRSPLLVFVFRT